MDVFELELEYLKTITLEEVSDDGVRTLVAEASKTLEKQEKGFGWATELVNITSRIAGVAGDNSIQKNWRLFHQYGERDKAA